MFNLKASGGGVPFDFIHTVAGRVLKSFSLKFVDLFAHNVQP